MGAYILTQEKIIRRPRTQSQGCTLMPCNPETVCALCLCNLNLKIGMQFPDSANTQCNLEIADCAEHTNVQ